MAWLGVGSTAIVLSISQPPLGLWWLGPIALVPWLASARGRVALILGGFLWGTASGLAMGHWIYVGLRSVGAEPFEAASGLLLAAAAITGVPGLLYGASALLARGLPVQLRGTAFAAGVVLVDWVRGLPAVGLPWSLLGHTQGCATGVAQLALLGGVPAVSGLLAGLSYELASDLRSRGGSGMQMRWVIWLGGYVSLLLLGLPVSEALRGAPSEGGEEVRRLLAIQPRIPPGDRWIEAAQERNVALLARRTLAALEAGGEAPDLVIWPETTITVPLEDVPSLRLALSGWAARFESPILLGGVSDAGSERLYRNSAIWLDSSRGLVDRFHKTMAVPFVERAPASQLARRLRDALGTGGISRLVVEGDEERPLRGDDSYAVALCFEVIFPGLISRRLDRESIAIVNLANDAWYRSSIPGRQQLAFSRFRAIENRRYLVRVADSGPSAVVDPYGRIVRELHPEAAGALAAEIRASSGPGRHEHVGVLSIALSGAVLGVGVRRVFRRRSR